MPFRQRSPCHASRPDPRDADSVSVGELEPRRSATRGTATRDPTGRQKKMQINTALT